MSSSDHKPGFFQKLFGRSKSSPSSNHKKDKAQSNSSEDSVNSSHQKPYKPPPAVKLQTQTSAPPSGASTGRSPNKLSVPTADGAGKQPPRGHSPVEARQTSRTAVAAKAKKKGSKYRKRSKASVEASQKNIDTARPLEFPTTPEMILTYHQAKRLLDKNEEWLLVELNEYECLVDGLDIIRTIAKHSKFFEVEPDELWEEFFEYVDEMPSYDEVINFDVWQEFRDNKYPC